MMMVCWSIDRCRILCKPSRTFDVVVDIVIASRLLINIINWPSKKYLISVQSTIDKQYRPNAMLYAIAFPAPQHHRAFTASKPAYLPKQIICDYYFQLTDILPYNQLWIFFAIEKKVTVDHIWKKKKKIRKFADSAKWPIKCMFVMDFRMAKMLVFHKRDFFQQTIFFAREFFLVKEFV